MEPVVINLNMNKRCDQCKEPGATDGGLCLGCINKNIKGGCAGPWSKANDEVLATARVAIDQWHPELVNARIGFMFRDEATKSQGRQVWGQASKVADKMKALVNLDFVVWVAFDIWESLTSDQRLALIDHELCHCQYYAAEEKAVLRGHDIEEFLVVIERHGYWNKSLFRLELQNRQLKLDFFGDESQFDEHRGDVVSVDPQEVGK